jgi:hypothetical protein
MGIFDLAAQPAQEGSGGDDVGRVSSSESPSAEENGYYLPGIY